MATQKTVAFESYTITRDENNKIIVTKNGEVQDNAKGALREIASKCGFEVDNAWTTQQFGCKLIAYIEKNNSALDSYDYTEDAGNGLPFTREELSIALLREWDLKVFEDSKYGNEQKLIYDFLNKYKNNTDPIMVAAKISIIDLTNSTQLSKYKSRISLSDLSDIIVRIKDFDIRVKNGDVSLVREIALATSEFKNNKEGKGVNLFSFASKYCHYHNYCVYGRDDYSIYDSVVQKHLYQYSLSHYPINERTLDRWRSNHDYEAFNSYINEILDANGIDASVKGRKRCFDHYLWFKYREN